ncbi:hypothetical protein Ciccas_000229 [Cichlidogyrus casuarinus]|uniref:Granulins domain-containing protein n=1 Tax=Cichlidogyrus casuarinus TaxID=1844966 RepID=A0ABD2QNL3_9PLAT
MYIPKLYSLMPIPKSELENFYNFLKGSCCENAIHCCPEGFMCLSSPLLCAPFFPSLNKLPVKPIQTVELGVCCSDGKHCCASDETCDLAAGKCIGPSADWLPRQFSPNQEKENMHPILRFTAKIKCPGDVGDCPDDNTCCPLKDSSYGCCPYPQATCCPDKLHCCPHDTICHDEEQRCIASIRDLDKLINPEPSADYFTDVYRNSSLNTLCPSGKAECADDQTCCKLKTGEYGCCPFERGVCCADLLHCCPEGTTCNSSTGSCDNSLEESPNKLNERQLEFLSSNLSVNSICPGGKQSCPEEETCCTMKSGDFGCCPFSRGICCSDGEHCCPSGTICDSSGTCRSSMQNVYCDDRFQCGDQETCCKLPNGKYECCPFPKAVCCEDHKHCCPNGYECHIKEAECTNSSGISIPWREKVAASAIAKQENILTACPAKNACPYGSTCCATKNGDHKCCMLGTNAVCCSDGTCCPSGSSCGELGCKQLLSPVKDQNIAQLEDPPVTVLNFCSPRQSVAETVDIAAGTATNVTSNAIDA